nr:Thymosin beta 4 [Hymenolepis microstoma]
MSEAAKVVADVSSFNKDVLKHVDPEVKNPLPTQDVIEQEKVTAGLMKEIQNPPPLKATKTVEKIHKPTEKEIKEEKIEAEKVSRAKA